MQVFTAILCCDSLVSFVVQARSREYISADPPHTPSAQQATVVIGDAV